MVKKYGYARVSTKEQNLDRQILELKKYIDDERDIITDKQSGKDFDRVGYRSLRETLLRKGDTLIVKSLDRLGRNKQAIKDELEYFRKAGIRVQILDLPTTMIDFPNGENGSWIIDMLNNIIIEVLASMAEQERLTIRKRQAEGIAAAKLKGKHLGRPKAEYPSDWAKVYGIWKAGNITAVQAMQELNLKKATFYKLAKNYENLHSL